MTTCIITRIALLEIAAQKLRNENISLRMKLSDLEKTSMELTELLKQTFKKAKD